MQLPSKWESESGLAAGFQMPIPPPSPLESQPEFNKNKGEIFPEEERAEGEDKCSTNIKAGHTGLEGEAETQGRRGRNRLVSSQASCPLI